MTAKRKKYTPSAKTKAKRAALVAASKSASEAIELMVAQGHEELSINEYLMAGHKALTGCEDFRTFNQWKEEGFKVKKGSTSFDIWGSPRKAKAADSETEEGETEEGRKYKLFPVCSLFNENQVEPIDGSDPESKKSDSEKNHTQDMGNNESLSCGLFPQDCGGFLAMTFTESKIFKTEAGAVRWLSRRGLNADGSLIEDQKEVSGNELQPVSNAFVIADYSEKQEARKERLEDRANAAANASNETYNRAKDMASVIPFGQPILVGHHSERRDRNYREKIHNTYGKSFKLQEKAERLSNKAASVGSGGIASDDPEALIKLNEKLAGLQASQETMKAVNKIVRSKKLSDKRKVEKITEAGFLNQAQAEEITKPDFAGRVGYASYRLSNNNAEIRRVEKRIKSLGILRTSQVILV